MNKQVTVFVGVLVKNKKILLNLRDEKECPDAHLKWELPGGKCNFGETPEEAVKREFLEETGIEIKVKKLIPYIFTYNWKYDWGIQQTIILSYLCSYVKKVSDVSDHHVKTKEWVPLKDLKKRDLLAGAGEIIEEGLKLTR